MSEGARKLSEEELYQCLKSLNVPVRLSDLKTPTKDFIIRVFECFLKDLQIDIRNQRLQPYESLKHIEYPEISEDARMLTLLIITINVFTRQDGLVLNLKDITEPKPKRTKKILNYLIVFWNYCLTKHALIQSIEEGFQKEKEVMVSLIKENESLEEQYNDLLFALKNMQPSKEELNQCVALNNNRLQECIKRKEADAVEYQDLKKKDQDLRIQIAAAEMNIISVKESISELDQCILTSPERFTVDISKLKDLIKNEELKIREKDSELKEKMKMVEGLNLAQEENMKAVELLQKIEESYAELSNAANMFVQQTQKIKHQEGKMEKLTEELLRKKESKYLYEEKSVQIQLNTDKQMETFTETLQTLLKDITEEQELLAISKTTTSDLLQKIDKAADDALEVVELCNQTEAETEKAHVAYSAQMEAISTHFRQDCEEIKNKAKLFFES